MEKNIYLKISALVLFLFLSILSFFLLKSIFPDIQKVKIFIDSFGILSPIVFILLQILQVIIAPIPGQLVGFIGGYLFGVLKGTLYSTIGQILGTLIVVLLVKKFGEPFVRRIVNEKVYRRFEGFFGKGGVIGLFLFYLLPFFPDDAITIIAGLSKIKTRDIVLMAFLGRLPGTLGLSLIGAGIAESKANFAIILLSALVLISFVIYLYRDKLEDWMTKFVQKLKNSNSRNIQ